MAKLLKDTIGASEKHAGLSDFEFRLWTQLLPVADAFGRFPLSGVLIHSQAMPLKNARPVDVEAAAIRIARAGLFHIYSVGSKRFLVYHDHDEHNPSKFLKNRKARWPAPPPELCRCLREPPPTSFPTTFKDKDSYEDAFQEGPEEEPKPESPDDVRRALKLALDVATKIDSFEAWERYLFAVATKQTHAANNPATVRQKVKAMIRRHDVGPRKLEAYLLSPEAAGQSVNTWEDHFKAKPPSKADRGPDWHDQSAGGGA